jgi:catechol 2,3-dioxygenase-like lactoylglutathione lyase family enzyme
MLMSAMISGIRTAEIGVNDLGLTSRFYQEVWGLQIVTKALRSAHLRGSTSSYPILKLSQGSTGISRIVFQARSLVALEELRERVSAARLPVSSRVSRLDEPGDPYGFDSRDPEGRTIAFAWGPADVLREGAPPPDQFTKITHLNLNCGAYDVMRAYMTDVLGFRVIDETNTNGFFNCDVDHHSLVIARTPTAPTLNHIAFEMPNLDSMMRMCGTMREHGYPIEWGVGRHGPGDNVFAYFAGPEEMPIECTAEVLQVDGLYTYRGPESWNFPPGRSDQWGVTGPPSLRIKRIQTQFPFTDVQLR